MRTITTLLFACAFAVAATPASAVLYNWNTVGTMSSAVSGAITFTSTSGGLTLTARAYSTPNYDIGANPVAPQFNIDGAWVAANIAAYGGGIGVSNLVTPDSLVEGASPNDAIDNYGVKDIVVFELPGVFDPAAFKLGWAHTDSDVQAWVGGAGLGSGYNFNQVCFSGCANTLSSLGFVDIGAGMPVVSGGTASPGGASSAGGVNVPTGVDASFNTVSTGRYIIMSGNLGLGSITAENDYFKISALSASKIGGAPVPGSLLLLIAGIFALVGVRKASAPQRLAL